MTIAERIAGFESVLRIVFIELTQELQSSRG